jgi:hypothetical protein
MSTPSPVTRIPVATATAVAKLSVIAERDS